MSLICSAAWAKSRMRTASARWSSTRPGSHSAPSWTAQTSVAFSNPRRCVSTRAACSKLSASASREKVGKLLRTHFPSPIARHLPNHQRLDFCPLAPNQRHHRSIRTHRLFVAPGRLGCLLLESLGFLLYTANAAPSSPALPDAPSLCSSVSPAGLPHSALDAKGIQLAKRARVASARGVIPATQQS